MTVKETVRRAHAADTPSPSQSRGRGGNRLPSLARAKFLRDPKLRKLFAAIAAAGGEARVAGGAVRNALMKVPVTEIDLACDLSPEKVTAACAAAGFKVVPTGIEHGTVTVVVDHQPFEVTTLRHDIETDGRRAKVQYTDDWQADAVRRDFTMNALYCDATGRVSDFTDGYADILRNRIRFVGSPAQRITEDYLRILRFFRFHARFGKGVPDKAGLAACVRGAKGITGLSAERLRQEMLKLLAAPGAVATLKVMAKRGILKRVLPHTGDWRTIARLFDPLLRLHVLAAEPVALKERFKLSNAEAHRIETLIFDMPPTPALRLREQRIILYQLGPGKWRDLVTVAWARSKAALDDPAWKRLLNLPNRWPVPQLPVTGKDLIAMGMAPGPELGQALRKIEDWWMASDFKLDRQVLMQKAKT